MKPILRTLIFTGITAASLTLVAAGVQAQHRGKGGPMMFDAHGAQKGKGGYSHGHMGMMDMMRMAERLDLSDAQRDKIGKIMDDTRPKLRKNGFSMMDNRKEVHSLIQEGKVDDKKLRTLTRKQGDLVADMMYLQLKMRSDIHEVLTDEQREKMQQRNTFRQRIHRGDAVMPLPDDEDDD